MKFVPVPITGGATGGQRVLFSIWETRVQDYEAFVQETWQDSAGRLVRAKFGGGIYDLSETAWEWCDSLFDNSGEDRVLRGGAFTDGTPEPIFASHRIGCGPNYRSDTAGFRVVLAPTE